MRKHFILFLIITLIFINSFGQNFSGGFNFSLPAFDSTNSEYFPEFAEHNFSNDFVTINGDQFFYKSAPIRFWGVNMVADGAFPDKNKSAGIAARLKKFGINLVRFHHIDNSWTYHSLFYQGSSRNTLEFNTLNLDKIMNYIYHLKLNGIFINMNLNVSRTFKELDGVIDADSIRDFGKGLTYFDPVMIELQKEYARKLLTQINPYTGLPLADDPVMAMVEIVNENSLYRMWQSGALKSFSKGGSIPEYYSSMLDSMFNEYIRDKYQNDINLMNAWKGNQSNQNVPELIQNGGFESELTFPWLIELHNNNSAIAALDNTDFNSGSNSAKVSVNTIPVESWYIQFKHTGLSVDQDSLYELTFYAKTDGQKSLTVSFQKDASPWTFYSNASFQLNRNWQMFSVIFKAKENNLNDLRISFSFDKSLGNFWFDDVSFRKSILNGLEENESLNDNSVRRIDFNEAITYSNQRVVDISEFYYKIQVDFFSEMYSFLKNELGVKVPITGTNWNLGAPDLIVQSKLDYIDNHSYWDHPQFPGVPWSPTDWRINNTSMTDNIPNSTITGLFGGVQFMDIPYTVSEYNHSFPNIYQIEFPLFLSAYSSFHAADGIMIFEYNGTDEWEEDFIPGFFGISRNSSIMALMPTVSYLFRNNLIKTAVENIELNYTKEHIFLIPKSDENNWWGYFPYDRRNALIHSIKNGDLEASATTDFSSIPEQNISTFITDTEEIIWSEKNYLIVNTEKIKAFTGHFSKILNKPIPGIKLTRIKNIDFGTVTWLSLDSETLQNSKRSLLTLVSQIQNSNMIWDDNISVGDHWGRSPTINKALSIDLTLNINADSIKIIPLDNKGLPMNSLSVIYYPTINHEFQISLDQNITKTLWFGLESFRDSSTTDIESDILNEGISFSLQQNYPNPANPATIIRFTITETLPANLKIYDVLGREVLLVFDEVKIRGEHEVQIDLSGLSSGIYFYRLQSGRSVITKKLMLIK